MYVFCFRHLYISVAAITDIGLDLVISNGEESVWQNSFVSSTSWIGVDPDLDHSFDLKFNKRTSHTYTASCYSIQIHSDY